jgi:oligopeptide transport system ATP-binding protein
MHVPVLAVKDLRVDYPTRKGTVHAVDGISFDVLGGEIVALVGESGCGKSATAHALLRLIAPPGQVPSGQVLFNGEDLLKVSEQKIREVRGNRISMVFQEPMSSLNPVQCIGDQVAEPLLQHGLANKTEAWLRASELLAKVNIPDPHARLHDYPHQFSGGMRQRVMIAMAMACKPQLIIADEPTTALDVTVQAQIIELLKKAVLADQSAILLITHNLGVVARYADRVNVMYGGEIVESARADELYAQPQHPYTRGLMASVPSLNQALGERLIPISGQPFDALNPPAGCRFHPRCPQAMDRCHSEAPPTVTSVTQHQVKCWLALPKMSEAPATLAGAAHAET